MGCWGFHQPLASLSIIQQMGRTINGTAEHSRASRNHVPQNIVLTAHSEHWPGNFRWQFSREKSSISDTLRHKKVPKDRPRRWRKRNILSFPPLSAPQEAELYSHQIIETLRLSSLHPIITYIYIYVYTSQSKPWGNVFDHVGLPLYGGKLFHLSWSNPVLRLARVSLWEPENCLKHIYIHTHIMYIYIHIPCIDRCIIYTYICIRVCRYLYIYLYKWISPLLLRNTLFYRSDLRKARLRDYPWVGPGRFAGWIFCCFQEAEQSCWEVRVNKGVPSNEIHVVDTLETSFHMAKSSTSSALRPITTFCISCQVRSISYPLLNVYIMGKSPCYQWVDPLFPLGHFQSQTVS